MMLAQTVDLDVLHDDHLAMIFIEQRIVDEVTDLGMISFGQEKQSFGVSLRCALQAMTVWILAHAFEKSFHRTRRLFNALFGICRCLS